MRDNGIEPQIIQYLKDVPSSEDFRMLSKKLGKRPHEFIRKGESDFKENNIKDILNDDEAMYKAMNAFPKLMERPIVVTKEEAALCRPPEIVLEIL